MRACVIVYGGISKVLQLLNGHLPWPPLSHSTAIPALPHRPHTRSHTRPHTWLRIPGAPTDLPGARHSRRRRRRSARGARRSRADSEGRARVNNEDGSYTVDVETGNGIVFSEAGTLGTNNTAIKTGQYSYTAPDGSVIEVKFIANENGFQAESDALPVAPAFPHPIPDFVLEQIQFAAEEDARIAAEAEAALKTAEAPSNLYERPQ
nr:endocuticle structural glycoprotein SgAbd-1-like [Penaeus vannamei]